MAQNVNRFRRLNWLTVGIAAVNDATANRFGEAANWAAMVNGNPGLASSAWTSATLPMSANSSSFLSRETLGLSANLANLASVEATDGSSTKCLSEIAEISVRGSGQRALVLPSFKAQITMMATQLIQKLSN